LRVLVLLCVEFWSDRQRGNVRALVYLDGVPRAIVLTQGRRAIIHTTTVEQASSGASRSAYDRITSRNTIATSRISNAICPYN